ncbi:MAG TPA: aldehyde dehydrogenase family protein [Chthonomonadales bacterium]|nr:aldehyde dehydrogenase family protein [Chthonomonadales bacterium]
MTSLSACNLSVTSLLNQGHGRAYSLVSPIGGREIEQAHLWTSEQVASAIRSVRDPRNAHGFEALTLAAGLRARLTQRREEYLQAMGWETGFIRRDCVEMFEAALTFLDHFPDYLRDNRLADGAMPYTYPPDGRLLHLRRYPYGVVAVIAPQNAFLLLTLIAGLCALAMGNGVVVKAPSQSAWSAALLQEDLDEAVDLSPDLRLVLASAPDFLHAAYAERVGLLHYIGSRHHALDLLAECYRQSVHVLIDGEGNGYLYVDRSYPPDEAASIIVAAATRYNGATCTSVNGVLVDEETFEKVFEEVAVRLNALRCGNPFEPETDVGPLFSERQAEDILATVHESGGEIRGGGTCVGNYLRPTLVVRPQPDSRLVREGVFGPVVWMASTRGEEWREWFAANRYPLAGGILSHEPTRIESFLSQVRYARLSVNTDPSMESVFEPWGAYPGSGMNLPSPWPEKYQRIVQIDGRW